MLGSGMKLKTISSSFRIVGAAPVVGVLLDADVFARLPFGKLEGPRAQRAAVVPVVGQDVLAFQNVLGQNGVEECGVGGEGFVPHEDDGVRIGIWRSTMPM